MNTPSTVRLYAPSIVLTLWALVALALGRSTALTIAGLTVTAASMVLAELERQQQRRPPPPVEGDRRGRRAGDRGWRTLVRENAYRDVWLVAITALTFWSILAIQNRVERQREGRSIALNVSCGAVSAVIDAGRITISTSGRTINPQLARFLERHGYPPEKVRETQARAAAAEYARLIAGEVERQSGVKGMVRRDGSLDCDRLERAADASR